MSDLTLNVLGFAAVNKDLTVQVLDPQTQQVVREVQPFLDGTVRIPKIDPGAYEIAIKHPNLVLPVVRRPIRVLPVGPTVISVLIDPSKFRNTPIEEVPEANLGPVVDSLKSVAETVTPLASKHPGEAIRSDDWNTLSGSVRDLANSVAEMGRLVSPQGHTHPEYVQKFDEITTNFQNLLDQLSTSLAELQRQIYAQRLRTQVLGVLDQAAIDPSSAKGKEFLSLVDNVDQKVTESPTVFGREVRNAGVQLQTKLDALLDEKKADTQFATSQTVQTLSTAVDLAKAHQATTYDAELAYQRKTQRILGPAALNIAR
jgi:hypothetical protein